MFDVRNVNKRYFGVTLCVRNDVTEEVEKTIDVNIAPPKLKNLKKIFSLAKESNDENSVYEAVKCIVNNNSNHTEVPEEFIGDLTLDEMIDLLQEFFNWINEAHNSKN